MKKILSRLKQSFRSLLPNQTDEEKVKNFFQDRKLPINEITLKDRELTLGVGEDLKKLCESLDEAELDEGVGRVSIDKWNVDFDDFTLQFRPEVREVVVSQKLHRTESIHGVIRAFQNFTGADLTERHGVLQQKIEDARKEMEAYQQIKLDVSSKNSRNN